MDERTKAVWIGGDRHVDLSLGLGCAEVTEEDVAQGAPSELAVHQAPTAGGEARFERIAQELQLTTEQTEAVRPVFEQFHTERRALRDLPREERRPAVQQLRQDMRAQLEGVLTPEQLSQLDELRPHRRRGHRGERGAYRMQRLTEELNLDETQAQAVREAMQQMRQERRGLRDLEPEERRTRAEALRASLRGQLEGVLNEEQPDALSNRLDPRQRRMARLVEHLELTVEQRAVVEPIFTRAHERRRELRELDRAERREAMQNLRGELRTELSAHLDESQLERFDAMPQRRPHWGRRGHRHRHGR